MPDNSKPDATNLVPDEYGGNSPDAPVAPSAEPKFSNAPAQPAAHKVGDSPSTTPLDPYNPGTPNADYIHGAKSKLKFIPPKAPNAPTPPTTPIEFPIESMSMNKSVTTDDITHSMAGGWQVMLDGIRSYTGEITFVYDSLAVPGTVATYLAVLNPFEAGFYAKLYAYPDGVTPYIITVLINTSNMSIGPKAGTVRVTANYMSTGPAIRPSLSQTTATPPIDPTTSSS